MEDFEKKKENKESSETEVSLFSLHNIYQNIHISIKTLDLIIAFLVLALLLTLFVGIRNRGFTVDFDSMGGTDITSQKHLYGERIEYEIPLRDGYKFLGWSLNKACEIYWNEEDEITGSMKLYACWEP